MPYKKKSVHSLSAQRVWISVCACMCVCRVTWGPFRYFGSILLRAKNNCQLFPLFAAALSVCECVFLCVFACKLQLMIFIFLSTRCSLPRPKHLRIFLLILCPLSLFPSLCPPFSRYLFDCCHVRLFRSRCRCCCCSSAFFISCTESWSKEGIIKLQLDNIRDCRDCRYITACT